MAASWPTTPSTSSRSVLCDVYDSIAGALRAGARGYLTKDAGGEEIRSALQRVLDDHAVIDPAVQHHLIDAIARKLPGVEDV